MFIFKPTDPDTPPELALFCVACAEREFGTVDAP